MARIVRHALCLASVVAIAPTIVGIGPPIQMNTRSLGSAEAALTREFSQVRGIHELADGRVLITDRIDEQLFVADFATGRLLQISRTGPGPTEYRLPTSLLWMPGDSTLLVDEGNTRLVVVGPPPDLAIKRSFRIELAGSPPSNGVRAIDARGRFYLQSPFWIPRPPRMGDSVYMLRANPGRRTADTLGTVLGITRPPDGNKPRLTPGFPFVAMAAQDAWNVRRDGTIIVIRSNPYRMEWITETGERGAGPSIPYTPIKVTVEEKRWFTRQFLANSPTSGRGDDGMSATPASAMTEERVREMVATNAYAEFKGPTTGRAPVLSENGTAWVERSVPYGSATQFDVLGTRGEPLERIQLPKDRRLLAIGRTAVYLVVVDAEGVERVERYAIPTTLRRIGRF